MSDPRRKSGISILGDAPWGTHFCHFYRTKHDLIEVLVPYFKTGLENNEFCMWITSEPLNAEEARAGLLKAVPDLDQYNKKNQIEILDFGQWYTRNGKFDGDKVLQGWVDKEQQARKNGFEGLRLSGNTYWIEHEEWKSFSDYEAVVNNVIHSYHMLDICSYSLDKCAASEILDVFSTHQFALIIRNGKWAAIESTERKRAEEALQNEKAFAESVIDSLPGTFYIVDSMGRPLRWNKNVERIMGYSSEELAALDPLAGIAEEERPLAAGKMQEALARGNSTAEVHLLAIDGRKIPYILTATRAVIGDEVCLVGVGVDITERERAEQELRRVNRALRTISACNQAIARAAEERHLLEDLCGILVGEGGYRMAWVGFAEHDEVKSVRPVAHAGFEEGYLQTARITWADTDRGQGPTGTAIRTGKPVVIRDIQADPSFATWREDARKRGYASSIALPLLLNGQLLGALMIYAEEADAFDSVEMQLLTGLSNDLAYGIQALRTRAERQRAEEALRDSEERFRRLSEASIEGIAFSEAGKVTDANLRIAEMLGCGLRDLIGAKATEFVAAESLESVEAHMRSGSEEPYEHLARRKDGSIFPVEVRGAAVPWKGRLVRAAVIRDITERKRAEEALQSSERQTKAIVDASPIPQFAIDKNHRITHWNRALEEYSGIKSADVIGTNQQWRAFYPVERPCMADLLVEGAIDRIPQLYTECSPSRLIEGAFEATALSPTMRGGTWLYFTAAPIRDADGNIIGAVETLADITERKRAEEEWRESEERFRGLVENLPVGIYRTTPQGRILMANPAMVRMLGYEDFKELANRNLEEAAYEAGYPRQGFREHIERDGEVKGLEVAWTRRDGSVVFMRENGRVVRGESGNVLWYEGMVEDITEHKRTEEERQRSLEQLRALAARLQSIREEERKRVAREIHDQLGQALTAIKIDLSSLIRDLPADKKQRSGSVLNLIDQTIQSVRRISTELRPGILDDLGLVAAVEWAGEEFESRTGTKCRLDLPREDIAVDAERAIAIFRIFQETLTNVARHADASDVEVRLAKEDGNLTLEVHDNGKGIPKHKPSNGNSFGILGMRERAMLLGGELTISGPPGNGTTVSVRIPEARQNQPE